VKLRFDDRCSAAAFTDQRHAHDALLWRRDALDREISIVVEGLGWAQTIRRLCCFRGVDTLTAAGVPAEIGDGTRFADPKQLGCYLGIVPSEDSSGARLVRGSITKPGRATPGGESSAHQPGVPAAAEWSVGDSTAREQPRPVTIGSPVTIATTRHPAS
jgi:hypothetical protein